MYLFQQIMSMFKQQTCFLNVVTNLTGLLSVWERRMYVTKSDARGQYNATRSPPVREGQLVLELVY